MRLEEFELKVMVGTGHLRLFSVVRYFVWGKWTGVNERWKYTTNSS